MRNMWPNRLRNTWRAVSDAPWAAQFELRPGRRSTRWRARAQGVGSVPPSRKKLDESSSAWELGASLGSPRGRMEAIGSDSRPLGFMRSPWGHLGVALRSRWEHGDTWVIIR